MANRIVCYREISEASFVITSWSGGSIESLGRANGYIFMSIPEDVVPQIPFQDTRIEFHLASPEEIAAIKAASPVIKGINEDIEAVIRSKYSLGDEFRACRLGDPEYLQFVTATVSAGKERKLALGF